MGTALEEPERVAFELRKTLVEATQFIRAPKHLGGSGLRFRPKMIEQTVPIDRPEEAMREMFFLVAETDRMEDDATIERLGDPLPMLPAEIPGTNAQVLPLPELFHTCTSEREDEAAMLQERGAMRERIPFEKMAGQELVELPDPFLVERKPYIAELVPVPELDAGHRVHAELTASLHELELPRAAVDVGEREHTMT